jgi:hypothetical protein
MFGIFLKVHDTPAAVHPSQGGSSEHLIFRTLQASQARFKSFRPGVRRLDMLQI